MVFLLISQNIHKPLVKSKYIDKYIVYIWVNRMNRWNTIENIPCFLSYCDYRPNCYGPMLYSVIIANLLTSQHRTELSIDKKKTLKY